MRGRVSVACTLLLGLSAAMAAQPPAPSTPPPAVSTIKVLYLTFDADMTPGMAKRAKTGTLYYDAGITDYLREQKVPYTIYMAGLFAEVYSDFVKRVAADPLAELEAHGYEHAGFHAPCNGLAILTTDAAKSLDIERAREALKVATGKTPSRFRFPGLCHSTHDDELVRQAGLTVDVPTLTSGDAFNPDASAIVFETARRAKDGSVILFHLGGPNAPSTLKALKELVPMLQKKGFGFRPQSPQA